MDARKIHPVANDALTFARATHKRLHGTELPVNPVLLTVFAVIDHYNGLHLHDRNRHGEDIRRLKGEQHALTKDEA
jgi:hypothetical protein